jgi:hypothetical protein
MEPGELVPSNETLTSAGVSARAAYAAMLLTRDQLIQMFAGDTPAEAVEELMDNIAEAEKTFQQITTMLCAAQCRLIAAASAHVLAEQAWAPPAAKTGRRLTSSPRRGAAPHYQGLPPRSC